ncbi:OLC1v1003088C1 [Oldenlandia corymbosa var. corymbosa]|uniref:OLC1v1003088C1 n=1 Tax=Oldenlandia corymbosa var. corymbosa TaxID=529605 RepID=A0AAV1D9E9_OLDCO|nr:OLC1v1003088C1 [Oldenlandia corymbosa var. corymbosa]
MAEAEGGCQLQEERREVSGNNEKVSREHPVLVDCLRLEKTRIVCNLLSTGRDIDPGLIPFLVENLARNDYPDLQFEAAFALSNIACRSSAHIYAVVEHDAVPIFIKLLDSPRADIRELGVCALGNIAGFSPSCRDLVLRKGALSPLLARLNEHVRRAVPALQLLIHFGDKVVLEYACWALSYISDGSNDQIQALIGAGVCPRLVKLLMHTPACVLFPALRTVGNIARGDDRQRQCIIDHGALLCLQILLNTGDNIIIMKEACSTISAFAAGNAKQNQAVFDAELIQPLFFLLEEKSPDLREEAGKAIISVIAGGSCNGIRASGLKGFIRPLCDLLRSRDPEILNVCLDGLELLCKPTEEEKQPGCYNYFARLMDEAEGLDRIKLLQTVSEYPEIREKALKIWDPLYSEALKVWKYFEELGDVFF